MFAPLAGALLVTQLHGSLRGGLAEAYTVNHDGIYYRCHGHAGIDFNAAVGTPVMAMKGGILSVAPHDPWKGGYSTALGIYAVITLPGGETHLYAHLSSVDLPAGPILPTTVFARSGNTGNSSGPHLHLAVRPAYPDWGNFFDGTVSFLDRFNHDVYPLLDLSLV